MLGNDLPLGLALAAYGATLIVSLVQVYQGKLQPVGPGVLTGIAMTGQLIDLLARAQEGPMPWHDLSGALLLASLLSAVMLLSLRTFLNAWGLYAFGTTLPFTLLVMGALIRGAPGPVPEAASEPWSLIHIPFAALGLAMLGVAAIAVGAYTLKSRLLKAKQVKGVANMLPSLTRLDRIVLVGAIGGFVCLTMGLITGAMWASHGGTTAAWRWSLKEIAAILSWLVFAAYLYVRLVAGWQGTRTRGLLLTGFVLVGVIFVASARY